jgi:hypothetical protein
VGVLNKSALISADLWQKGFSPFSPVLLGVLCGEGFSVLPWANCQRPIAICRLQPGWEGCRLKQHQTVTLAEC